jgi:cell division protein FtsI/penicillin-binding protein 2
MLRERFEQAGPSGGLRGVDGQGGRDLGRHRVGRGAHARTPYAAHTRAAAAPLPTERHARARPRLRRRDKPRAVEAAAFKDYTENPYRSGDIVGQEGLESTYDRYLRGRDGYREVEVDSRGRIQRELSVAPPQPGQDIITTIDLDMQLTAEEQLRNSPNKRGVIVVMEPQSGEILAMASYPTFDPNLFSQRIGTPEGRKEANALLRDPTTPMFNRAIRGRYPPGSTWKIPMAVAGLQQGAITMKNSHLVCGGGIQVGNKFTRCMGSHGSPELHTRYATRATATSTASASRWGSTAS